MVDFKNPLSINRIHSNGTKTEDNGFCLVCKEKTNSRFEIEVKDSKIDNTIKASICRDCFDSFLGSYHEENVFTISRFLNRAKNKFSEMRL